MRKIFLTLCASLLLIACGGNKNETPREGPLSDNQASTETVKQGRNDKPEDGVTFHRGNGAEPDTLDPHKSEETSASAVLRDLFEGLTTENVDADVVPGQAERWDISEDLLTYTFYLRDGIKWSNGDPVVAEDFVVGMRRTVDPKTLSTYAQILDMVENAKAVREGKLPPEQLGVRAVSDKVLEIKLNAPTPYFLGLLNHATTFPIHRASWEAHGDKFAKAGTLVSNGAYELKEWVVASHIKLQKNPNYYDAKNVQIETVYFYPTEDQSAELKRFRAAELDYTNEIPNNQFDFIQKNLKDNFHVAPYLGTYYYVFDNTQPPYNDVKLRQALNMALDRQTLVDKITKAGQIPAYGFVPPNISGYEGVQFPWADWPREKQLAEAKRLYAEAGYSKENPLVTELRYNTSENHKKIAVAIAQMWKQALGVDVKLLNEEWKVFLQTRQDRNKWELVRYGWIGDYNDANTYAEIMHSTHGQNDSGFNSPEYDRLVEEASREGDMQKRAALLKQAETVMLENYPIMPIYFYVSVHLVSDDVKGFKSNIMNHNMSRHYRIER